ncbi:MAG: rRNA maturation RNase YbeY [Flavobacteriales bacterium]|jgi:rRNA maturation RNase YbeY|nr:rRNA maturation RNase YbeY [Flavobacteriales bacterium]MBT6745736.1 rRNA maturation RNase YbeY [Flavobacteriales bacterium]
MRLIIEEGFKSNDINFIFTSDEYLLEINKKYLGHDYYTDVITFDYSEMNAIGGDVFLSYDRMKNNCKTLKINEIDEVNRVLAHGVLHLCGYNDKTKQDKREMTSKEDYYLSLRDF